MFAAASGLQSDTTMRPLLVFRICLATTVLGAAAAYADEVHAPVPTASPSLPGLPPELALGVPLLALPSLQDVGDDRADDDRPAAAGTAYAQAIAGTTGLGLGAGASAAVMGYSCDLARGSVQGVLHAGGDDAAPLAGVARYDLCLDLAVFLRLRGDRSVGLVPAIDARRSLWRRPYTAHYQSVEMGLGPVGDANRYSLFHMTFGHGETAQTDGNVERRIVDIDFDFALFTYQHTHALQLDALVVTSDALKAGDSDLGAVVTGVFPARARVDRGDWYASGHAGWEWAGGRTTQTGSTQVNGQTVSSYSETVDASGLPAVRTLAGEGTFGVHVGRYTGSTTLSHELYATFDGNVALETRAAGLFGVALGAHRDTTLAVSPFIARTQTWQRDAGDALDTAAGAQVRVGHPLPHALHLDALAEAGRSPYARTDGARDPSSALGGQVMVAVSAQRSVAHQHVKLHP